MFDLLTLLHKTPHPERARLIFNLVSLRRTSFGEENQSTKLCFNIKMSPQKPETTPLSINNHHCYTGCGL